jgi:hypothetical protein
MRKNSILYLGILLSLVFFSGAILVGAEGCCSLTKSGAQCMMVGQSDCKDTSEFSEGVDCSYSSFCQEGCCYDEARGIFDSRVLKTSCGKSWIKNPTCDLPGAQRGCCVLGEETSYETKGQCEVDTLERALGNGSGSDWRVVDRGACSALAKYQARGACVDSNQGCKFITESECWAQQGQFSEGYLCTSPKLNTSCKMTKETTCVDGKDGVYFVDSCGNTANIYDISKLNDSDYWAQEFLLEDSCGFNASGGNANSTSCGNCNRFKGGMCRSATENHFEVSEGDYYCKDLSCVYNGALYDNGESWCTYDGRIGNGSDTVGSRHWRYTCNYGEVQIDACDDYRNEICVQNFLKKDAGNSLVEAKCIKNDWRKCIEYNGDKEKGADKCTGNAFCEIRTVTIDKFVFNVCSPKFPGGFDLLNVSENKTKKNEAICSNGTATCTSYYVKKLMGGWVCKVNCACETIEFVEKMNDVCVTLGDCGGYVNYIGDYTDNGFSSTQSAKGGSGGILGKVMSNVGSSLGGGLPIVGGLLGKDCGSNSGMLGGVTNVVGGATGGVGGVSGGAIPVAGGVAGGSGGSTVAGTGGCGVYSGNISINKSSRYSLNAIPVPGLYVKMSEYLNVTNASGKGSLGISNGKKPSMSFIENLFVKIGLMGTKKVKTTFTCKPWQPPVGAANCNVCNLDPLKPCSEYRCESLGAGCEIVNKGTVEELCAPLTDDGMPPTLEPALGTISDNEIYSNIVDDGFDLTSRDGGCIAAYTPLTFGINTNELAQCKFSLEATGYELMEYDLGGANFIFNHTTTFILPDPSHGQSQGANWTGDLTFYIKCRDRFGHETPNYYNVNMCVKEGPDKTAPIIRGIDPENNTILKYGTNYTNVSVITNELAQCRWSYSDMSYSLMGNNMTCEDTLDTPSSTQGYVCMTPLTLVNSTNDYYIRCIDQPWLEGTDEDKRNANAESTLYRLRKPDKKISIEQILPNSNFESPTENTDIELEVTTANGGEEHICSYSLSGYEKLIEMFETGEKTHKQPLNRPDGTNKIYVECVDETGDSARVETEFKIIWDTSSPQIARVWQESGQMFLVTTEPAECKLSLKSCKFKWEEGESLGEGEEHNFRVIKGNTYYIKCRDEYGNIPSGCSIEARAL